MPRRALKLALVLPLSLAASSQTADPPRALPYELAFDLREFLWSTSLAVAPGGTRVAYEVRQPPPDSNLSARYMPNGTPSSVVGSKIYLTDWTARKTIELCPGGSCWRPAWAPDGKSLAFYSDAGGPPQ